MKAALGEANMAQSLQVAEYAPVPDPGERPERSRKLVKALLDKKAIGESSC